MSFQEGFDQRWAGYEQKLSGSDLVGPLKSVRQNLSEGSPFDLGFLEVLAISQPGLAAAIRVDVELQEVATHAPYFPSVYSTIRFALENRTADAGQKIAEALREGLDKNEGSLHVAKGIKLAQVDNIKPDASTVAEVDEILMSSEADHLFEAAQAARTFVVSLERLRIEDVPGERFFAPRSVDGFKLAIQSLAEIKGRYGVYGTRWVADIAVERFAETMAEYLRNPSASDEYKDLVALNVRSVPQLKRLVVPSIEYLEYRQAQNLEEFAATRETITKLQISQEVSGETGRDIERLEDLQAQNLEKSAEIKKEIISLQKLQISQEVLQTITKIRNGVDGIYGLLPQSENFDTNLEREFDEFGKYLGEVKRTALMVENRSISGDFGALAFEQLPHIVHINQLKQAIDPFRKGLYALAQDPDSAISMSQARELFEKIDAGVGKIRREANSLRLNHPTPVGGFSATQAESNSNVLARTQVTVSTK